MQISKKTKEYIGSFESVDAQKMFSLCIENYINNNFVEPKFKNSKLREIWFLIKIDTLIHNLESEKSVEVQHKLCEELNLNAEYFDNYRAGKPKKAKTTIRQLGYENKEN